MKVKVNKQFTENVVFVVLYPKRNLKKLALLGTLKLFKTSPQRKYLS